MDNFDKARESIWGLSGFEVRQSTIQAEGTAWLKSATWVLETVRTDDTDAIFLQWIGEDGGQRIVIPHRVVEAIRRHQDSIAKARLKTRGQRAAATRKSKQQEVNGNA
jgi:hypothetical protein